MKVYILGDLEGAATIVDFEDQTYKSGKYYHDSKRLSTLEINALIDGVIDGGATDVIFLDGHGPGGIDYELIHAEAKMIIGRPITAPWELDQTFDAFLLYGHHSMANTPRGVLCHSWSSRSIANCWLNGELIGEIGFNMAIAGSFGIPTIFVSGDDTAIDEAKKYVPEIVSVETKVGISRTSAISISPIKSRQLHREFGKVAMSKIGEIKPFTIEPPYEFVTELLNEDHVASKSKQPHVDRISATKYKVTGETLIEIARKR